MNTASELLDTSYEEEACIARAKQILQSRIKGTNAMDTPQVVKDYLIIRAANLVYEVFSVMFLDSKNRVMQFEEMFRGTLTQTSVYPREVVVAALKHNASAVVLSHNHPSGVPTPSRADEALTKTLKSALALVDVRVLDHIIVAGGTAASMAEMGLL